MTEHQSASMSTARAHEVATAIRAILSTTVEFCAVFAG